MLSHVVLCTYQSSAMDPETTVVDLNSPCIAHRVQQQLGILRRDELSTFPHYRRAHTESTALAGWVFANMVIHRSSTVVNALSAPLPAISVSPSTWSSTICSGTPISGHSAPNTFALRRTRLGKNLENIILDDRNLYIPPLSNLPFLVPFYLVVGRKARRVKVVVLQITIYLAHKESPGAFMFVEQSKAMLHGSYPF
ncbi:hypothetical protein EYR38_010487 [Pleurotus pulmonarius]|nr:hypothetical protein EYR38_010487 [Pleurotus pulmonarius]